MQIVDRYYRERRSKLPSGPSSRYLIELLREFCADMSVADFKIAAQERIRDALIDRGKSPGYVSAVLSVARAALRRAYKSEEIASVPPFIELAKSEPRERVLSMEESAALFNAANDTQFRYLLLAFGTGARPGAILDLGRMQLDFERRLIRLNPHGRAQTKKRRPTVPMVPTLVPWLEESGPSYVIHHNGRRYSRDGWHSIFARLVKRAGLKGVGPYTIRHTVATELASAGVPWLEIQMMLGHSAKGLGITGGYIHLQPEYLSKAIAAIEAYFARLVHLVKRPISRIQIEEQPTPDDLRASCVPQLTGTDAGIASNVLNRLQETQSHD
jgi:integrase